MPSDPSISDLWGDASKVDLASILGSGTKPSTPPPSSTKPPPSTGKPVPLSPTTKPLTNDELWGDASKVDLGSILGGGGGGTRGPGGGGGGIDPEVDLSTLGLPLRGSKRRSLPKIDPEEQIKNLANIPDITTYRNYKPEDLIAWPQVDILIQEDLLFIIIDAAGFDLGTYFFEEAEPSVLVMIGQKRPEAAFEELEKASPNLWVFRQRPIGNTFVRKIDLSKFNFKLDPSTLTYANYNGCIIYRGLREELQRPKQLFHYK